LLFGLELGLGPLSRLGIFRVESRSEGHGRDDRAWFCPLLRKLLILKCLRCHTRRVRRSSEEASFVAGKRVREGERVGLGRGLRARAGARLGSVVLLIRLLNLLLSATPACSAGELSRLDATAGGPIYSEHR